MEEYQDNRSHLIQARDAILEKKLKKYFEDLIPKIKTVPSETKYWLIRTRGGRYYNNLIDNKRIVINYDKIRKSDLINDSLNKEELKKHIMSKLFPSSLDKRNSLPASQLIKFTYDIKKDDIVMIPSVSSEKIMIGKVVDDVLYEGYMSEYHNGKEVAIDGFLKYRKVEWLREIRKEHFNPLLYQLFFSHQAVVDATEYKSLIDNSLHDFYRTNDKYHLLVRVNTTEPISAIELYESMYLLTQMATEISNNPTDFETKINLNSPGLIEFASIDVQTMFYIGAAIITLLGGKFEVKGGKIETQGLLETIRKFINDKREYKLKKYMIKLGISSSKDMQKLLDGETSNEGDSK